MHVGGCGVARLTCVDHHDVGAHLISGHDLGDGGLIRSLRSF